MNDEESNLKDFHFDKKIVAEQISNKNYEEVEKIFEKRIVNDSEDEVAWLGKANTLLHLYRYEEGLKACEKLIEICKKYSEISDERTVMVYSGAWVCRQKALSGLKKYYEALEMSEKAIEICEEYSGALTNGISIAYSAAWISKGHVLSDLKIYDKAYEAFDKAIEIRPSADDAWIGKCFAAFENHKSEKALEVIENAILSNDIDDKLTFLTMKGLLLALDRRYGKALEVFNNAIEINPQDAVLWLNKGDVFFNLEAYNYALKSYEKAITIEPKNVSAWKFKSMSLLYLNRNAEFQEALEQALHLDPKDSEIHNILAEYHLICGDIINASKHVENAFLIDKENAKSSYIMGKIKIEEQDYTESIKCFKKAISLDLRNEMYLVWEAYAKYLMAELELAPDEKRYQDMILGIIRELRKIDNCNDIEYNNSKVISDFIFSIIPYQFKNLIVRVFEFLNQTLIDLNTSEKNTVKVLEVIHPILTKFESTQNAVCNYYFLGCFYYKINDYFTAIDYFKKCNKLSTDDEISKSASEILDNIWNTKIRPSIWKWWLYSPSNLWFKRISFLILSYSLLEIILPFNNSKFFQNIFFYSVNWAENTIQLTLLTLAIVFILTSPNIQYFKSSQIEIEIRPPTTFELIPSLIEKKLDGLKHIDLSEK